jgi:hypothetical protein
MTDKRQMLKSRISVALALMMSWAPAAPCQNAPSTSSVSQNSSTAVSHTTPAWLPFALPPELYERWRKYGPWDYKQQGFKYRDYTRFGFGATGSAAGFDVDALTALTQAARPNPADLHNLAEAHLEKRFDKNEGVLEKLRVMAEEDPQLIRIAADFTYLASNDSWPRKDIGVTNSRWDAYQSLFQKVPLQEGIVRTEDFPGAIFFVAVSRGLCTGGSSAGYVYSTKKLSPTSNSPVKALDGEAREKPDRNYAYAFKELKRNWYVFYELDW